MEMKLTNKSTRDATPVGFLAFQSVDSGEEFQVKVIWDKPIVSPGETINAVTTPSSNGSFLKPDTYDTGACTLYWKMNNQIKLAYR